MSASAAEPSGHRRRAGLMPRARRDSIAKSRPRIREDAVIEARAELLLP